MALTSNLRNRSQRKRNRSSQKRSKFSGRAMYDGPKYQDVLKSIKMLIGDQIEQSELPIDVNCRFYTRVLHAVDNYLKQFFEDMKNIHTSEEAKQLADQCKEEFRESERLVDMLSSLVFQDELCISAVLQTGEDKVYDIQEVYYLPKDYRIFFVNEETDEIEGVYVHKPQGHGYGWLNQAIVLLSGLAFEQIDKLLEEDFIKISMLFRAALSVGELYTAMNPDDELLDNYADNSIDILESEVDSTMPDWLVELMDEWKHDLNEGRLPYIQEVHSALQNTLNYRLSLFNEDDYYFSNKSTSRRDPRYKSIHQSILMSMVEEKHHEDDPIIQQMEREIHYSNHYNSDKQNQPKKDVISREIRNPGKFKPRLIMLSDNEIQDLCTYIKNRYKAFLSYIESSCTNEQEKGCMFGLKITNPLLVDQKNHNVFCWDWEDATNNIKWDFDTYCFSVVFPHISYIWPHLCKMIKHHKYATQNREDRAYTQKGKGQPAGLGGSFDDMDWFHLVIIMLVMKLTGRENLKLSQVLRDLGDDDLTSTCTPDPPDPNYPGYRDEPGFRTPFELEFRRVCSAVGLKINDSKCIFNEYNPNGDNHYECEFAKVRIRDGKFASPLPPRIAARYYQPAYQLIALNWEMQHGWTSRKFIDVILSREFSDQEELYLAKILYKSGCVRGKIYDLYIDNTFDVPIELKALVKASYFVSCMRTASVFSMMSDFRSQFSLNYKKELDSFIELIHSPLLEKAWMEIEDDEHKFNILLRKNENIASVIGDLYGISGIPVRFATALLGVDRIIRDGFRKASQLMNLIPYWGEETESYFVPEAVMNLDCSDIIKACDQMLFKAPRKRLLQELQISHKAIKEALHILTFMPSIRDMIPDKAYDTPELP